MQSSRPDRFSLVIEFLGRAAFAALAFAYFQGLPDTGWSLNLPLAVAGLVFYLVAHGFLLAQRFLTRDARWQAPVATLIDFAAVLGAVASDPFPAPPTLLLLLVVALNAGLRHGRAGALLALAGTGGVAWAAMALRAQWQGEAATFGMLYLVVFMLACVLYFALLAIRRDAVNAQAARFPDLDADTQLLNRRGFDNAARYLVPLHHRTQLPLVVMLARLDTRDAGLLPPAALAKVARQFGHAVRQRARRSDVVARVADDEFLFLLFDTPLAGSEILARSLLQHFNDWAAREGADARLTFGMVNTPVDPVAVDQLIARARAAVERARKHPSSPGVVTASAS